MTEEYVRSVEEQQPIPLLPITIGRTFTLPAGAITDQAQTVYIEQSKVIREMAQKSDCVIVGRCADYVLRELSPFRLFIYADMTSKMERCRKKGQEKDMLSDQELQRKIRSVDKVRSKYYQFYSDQVWGDKKNYDLCINTSYIIYKKDIKLKNTYRYSIYQQNSKRKIKKFTTKLRQTKEPNVTTYTRKYGLIEE